MFSHVEKNFHRENRTVDIVRRVGVITPGNLRLKGHPVKRPVSAFNPSFIIEDGKMVIYARVILGYFTYSSIICEITLPWEEYEELSAKKYEAEIRILPDSKYDMWGAEDPRISVVDGKRFITYCGRTINYFNQSVWVERTLPIVARYDGEWKKVCVFRLPREIRGFLISDKDAFIFKVSDGYKLFHRLHMKDNNFYLVVSDVDKDIATSDDFVEIEVKNPTVVLRKKDFEDKIGWGTPPVKVDDFYVLFLHSVGKEMKKYRIFVVAMDENMEIIGVSPHYIMEPKEIYERYGDRPYAIFPCGAQLVDDRIIISYGAADSVMAFGEVDVNELLSIMKI